MTNREKIAEMKAVDLFAKFREPCRFDFTSFICGMIPCEKCPNPCTYECCDCHKNIDSWLDKECDD